MTKLPRRATVMCVCAAMLLLVVLGADVARDCKWFSDPFYASAIPGDTAVMGVPPAVLQQLRGAPREIVRVKDITSVGFSDDEYVLTETGEVLLKYDLAVLSYNGTVEYSYHEKNNSVRAARVSMEEIATRQEAQAILQELYALVDQAFAQKGDYTAQAMASVVSEECYRFRAERDGTIFMVEISYQDVNQFGLNYERPYNIAIYQNLFVD